VQNLSPVRPGDDYDRDKLVVYQRLLLESGYFVSVQADVDRNEGSTDSALVRVVVIEAPKHHVEAGINYATDTGIGGLFNYTNQALFDSAWRFRSTLRVDDTTKTLEFNLDSPPRPGGYWNSYLLRPYRETDIQNVRTREAVAGFSRNWGAEIPPSAVIFSANWEEESVSGGEFTDRTRSTSAIAAPSAGPTTSFRRAAAISRCSSSAALPTRSPRVRSSAGSPAVRCSSL